MRIPIEKLLQFSTDELWDCLEGKFTIVFPDGELETDAGHTLFSSYVWDIVREFSQVPLYTRNHLTKVLNGKLLSGATTSKILGELIWRVYQHHVYHPQELDALSARLGKPMDRLELKAYLAGRAFEIVNNIYNGFSYRAEAYVVSLKVEDFIEIIEYPEIAEILAEQNYTESHVHNVYATVAKHLIHEPDNYDANGSVGEKPIAYDNTLSLLVRSAVTDINQLNQGVGVRGMMTDTDSTQFPIPILRNLTNGIRSFHDSLIESRSASKALAFSTAPLQQTEYFNRRLQLTTMNLRHLDQGDCGSTTYLKWKVRPKDLPLLVGKYYVTEKGTLCPIRAGDKHLIDQTLQLRTVAGCNSINPQGVCETCFGELSFAVFRHTNLGWVCSTNLCGIISQSVLSVKHLDGSAVIEQLELDSYSSKYFRLNRDGDGYLISPDVDLKATSIVIRADSAPGITDVTEIDDVRKLGPSRVTAMDRVRLDVKDNKGNYIDSAEIDVGMIRRPASFTFDMLQYIRDNGWEQDGNGNYVISLDKWDARRVMMTVPHRHFNMSDLSKQVESHLESVAQVRVIRERDNNVRWEGFVAELFDLVNSRLKVNLAILEVISYCVMIQSAAFNEYSLPKPWTRNAFGVQSRTIAMRSESAGLAFEGQTSLITSPNTFNYTNRMDHPLDIFVDPVGVLEEFERRKSVNRVVRPITETHRFVPFEAPVI